MADDGTRTSSDPPEEPPDDLTRIPDLGPATAERLRRAGVRTYADLAASPAEEIARITGRSPRRVTELDWAGQARRLADEAADKDPNEESNEESPQHYESFTVRLLLENDNTVRRLSIKHTGTLDEEAWSGWAVTKLVDFIVKQAGVRTSPEPEPEPQPEPDRTAVPPGSPASPRPVAPVRHGQLQLKEVKVMSAGAGYPSLMVNANEPFTVRVTVDLESLERDGRSSLEYSASVVARLPGRQRRTVGEAQGKLEGSTGTEMIEVRSAGNGLDAGIYKLNIAIRFRDPATSQPIAFAALLEGQVLHVV